MTEQDPRSGVRITFSAGDGSFRPAAIPPKSPTPPPPPNPVRITQQQNPNGGPTITGPNYAPPVRPLDRSLAALRPRDDSSAAISDALGQIAIEREAAAQRIEIAQANRRRALTDVRATPPDLVAFERRSHEASIECERLDALAAELDGKLERALAREALAAVEVEQARLAHAQADAKLATALPGYEKAIEPLLALGELIRARDAAADRLRRAGVLPVEMADALFLRHLVVPSRAGLPLYGSLPPYVPQFTYPSPG